MMSGNGWFSKFHEGPILSTLGGEERDMVRSSLHDSNTALAKGLAPLFLLFVVLLLWVDIKRYQAGRLDGSALYVSLAFSHFLYALGVIPVFFLFLGERLREKSIAKALWTHVGVVLTALLLMAILGIFERGGLVLLAVTMLFGNLIYHLPIRLRMVFNGMALCACGFLVFAPGVTNELALMIRLLEVVALVFVSAVAGGLRSRQQLASVLAEHRLTQLAMLDAMTGVSNRREVHDRLRRELAEGSRSRSLSGFLRDNLNPDSSENLVAESGGEVARQLEILHAVSTRTKSAVVVTNRAGQIEWANHSFLVLTGYSREEVIGQSPGSFLQGPNTDPSVCELMRSSIAERRPFDVEVLNYTKQGEQYWVRVEAEPTFDLNGDFSGFVAIESDVTLARIDSAANQITQHIGEKLLMCQSVVEASKVVADTLVQAYDVQAAQVWTVSREQQIHYSYGAVSHEKAEDWKAISMSLELKKGKVFCEETDAPGVAWGTGETFQQDDWLLDSTMYRGSKRQEAAKLAEIRSICAVPVHGPEQEVLAVIEIGGSHQYPGHEKLPELLHRVSLQLGAYLLQREHLMRAEQANRELMHQISRRSVQLFSALSEGHSSGETQLSIGDTVNHRYRVEAPLGEGGMGMVFEVTRIEDHTRWAMKVTNSAEPQLNARIAREAHLLSKVRHPNIVQIVDVDIAPQGQIYLVMELVDGVDLGEWSKKHHEPELVVLLRILEQVTRGLASLHRQGIAHRDLKPQNTLVANDGDATLVKLADFGISRLVEEETPLSTEKQESKRRSKMDDSDALLPTLDIIRDLATVNLRVRSKLEDSSRALTPKASALPGGEGNLVLTDAGSLSGTPFYLAPDLRFSPSASPQVADMFSFGVLAYELLTNKKPFQEPVIYQSMPDSTPLSFSSGLDALDDLILRCLSFEPKERPTAHELNIELQGLVELVAVSPTI